MRQWLWLAGLALAYAGAWPAYAQLEFEKTAITVELVPQQDRVQATFAFRNAGAQAVTITNVQTTCGCTTATLTQKTYAPGEQGSISAELRPGTSPGRIEKKVLVKTDEPGRDAYALTIGTVVPQYLSVEPYFLKWDFGAEPTPKTLRVTVEEKFVIRVVKVHSSNPAWTTEVRTLKDGAAYEIVVTPPANMQEASRTALTLETDFPPDKPLTFRSSARVTQAKPSGPPAPRR